ncbi:cadmium-translocating P-type ATPase [Nostoc sp. 3335mG]|nr:cadmium-translocating P-type ATPase [Nostoc sp. 3335mG]
MTAATIDPADTLRSEFAVEGLRCANCISKLEHGLASVPGVRGARVNFTTRRVAILHGAELEPDDLCEAMRRIGFEAHPFAGTDTTQDKRESRALMLALAVAGFASMNVMLLSVSVWSGAEGPTRDLFHWLSALIAVPAIAYAGRSFFISAWRALRHGRTNMDVPIAIGVVLTTAMSLYETATGGPHAYFDGAIMLIFFLLAGRFLDSVMRARAQDGVAQLLRLVPKDVMLIAPDGSLRSHAAALVEPGMRVLVAAGERIGVDGIVQSGCSSVDRALVTGESAPEPVEPGGRVLAGTINLTAPLTLRATAAGPDTVIADIARLMENAGQSRSRYVRIADRASRLYAPAVHSLAALSFLGWLLAGAGVHQSAMIAIAVLIITCPCALGLAVPIAQVVASGALMRAGILIKDGSALERLAEVDEVLLDKTGTVTLGSLIPVEGMPDVSGEAALLLSLAQTSRHPLSVALARSLDERGVTPALIDKVEEMPGLGIRARWDGREVRLGRDDWARAIASATHVATATTLAGCTLAIEGGAVHRVGFADRLRPDAVEAVARLKAQGLPAMLVSGDSAVVVAEASRRLGILGLPRTSPAGKHETIERLQRGGHRVLMVGDGLNDGPALKAAHVSMAPASASDVGQLAADLLFFGDRLAPVPIAVAAARRTMRVVRQNFAIAIGYNVLAVPLAIAGMVTPLIAALAMSGSSLIVVANALRLRGAAR